MRALVRTQHGVYAVDLEDEEVLGLVDEDVEAEQGDFHLADGVLYLRAQRIGHGLPPGHAVAVDPAEPERVLYAGRNRLFLSEDGGRFWRALRPELPEIEAVAID